ncbi:MAG: MFS transporter, partial [Isosphaeraceae bacterium]
MSARRSRLNSRSTTRGYGWVLAAFQLSYAFFQWPAGYLVDRWNVRRTYAGAVLWWSFAGITTAFAPSLGLLMTFRALLGMGESFDWPCALRVTAGVLPPSDRSLGNGIFLTVTDFGGQLDADMTRQNGHDLRPRATEGGGSWPKESRHGRREGTV